MVSKVAYRGPAINQFLFVAAINESTVLLSLSSSPVYEMKELTSVYQATPPPRDSVATECFRSSALS